MSSDVRGLGEAEFDQLLQEVKEVGAITAPGKTISSEHVGRLIAEARTKADGKPVLRADFRKATFMGDADFADVTFKGRVGFDSAIFEGVAHFRHATFDGEAHFDEARFKREAHFPDARFECAACFRDAVFEGYVHFPNARFWDRAEFLGADLKAGVRFGPSLVRGGLVLDNASLGDVDMRVSTCDLSCQRTRFHEPAHLNIRWAAIHLEEAVFDRASTLAFLPGHLEDEAELPCFTEREPEASRRQGRMTTTKPRGMPRALSLSRADVGNLTLADIDLSLCEFDSALRLDEMRLATLCPFDEAPSRPLANGASFPFRSWWTKRLTIHEERCWRVTTPRGRAAAWLDKSAEGCTEKTARDSQADAERLAKIYRALRKGREKEGNAPGAGDFYYGEMEMRRHGQASRPERLVISLYWLVSGYGLRASRALVALGITIIAFAVALYLFGLESRDVGTALLQSVEAATLRSGDRDLLTGSGQGLQLALRLLGPLFFGLALLALRGRVNADRRACRSARPDALAPARARGSHVIAACLRWRAAGHR